jgi:hypothetical protein
MNNYEKDLKARYENLYSKAKPDGKTWMDVPPPIPFVGDDYGKYRRIKVLVYGSAENLTYLNGLFKEEIRTQAPMERNRSNFERWVDGRTGKESKSINNWFPWVHMTPISDGTLLTIARYLLDVFGKTGFATSPSEFIQQIAVGNYGKFSLMGKDNLDYASKPDLLAASHGYVLADMEILKPEVVIVPKTIHWSGFKELMNGHEGHSPKEVWRIYQTNGRASGHAKRELERSDTSKMTTRPDWVDQWVRMISPGKRGFMAHQLDWIDMKLEQQHSGENPDWHLRFPHA